MTTTQKRRPPAQENGATPKEDHGHSILPNHGIVNPKRRERLARRLRRAEAKLSRLAQVRERLALEMVQGGAS